jgi:hypothetical protein
MHVTREMVSEQQFEKMDVIIEHYFKVHKKMRLEPWVEEGTTKETITPSDFRGILQFFKETGYELK